MEITWLGHACFKIVGKESGGEEFTVVTDPFDPQEVGYRRVETQANVVTISHRHYDHNFLDRIKGKPHLFNSSGEHKADNVVFRGIPSYHDEVGGSLRGGNIIFVFEMEGISLCHLGDLGTTLESNQIRAIGTPGILLIPVGGVFTIDAERAETVVEQLHPKIVIPMHYKTPTLRIKVHPVDDFLKRMNVPQERVSRLAIEAEELPETTKIFVLSPP
jgi:L-ascorbate metabolism protein UlaG (beta-lactamase superfamily)